ncbi:hypothetical protein GCM10009853_055470 [Glycomyces scopariae]|uniref:Uncharacterized protein n=1 Tax=Glycomyces sambucus TaxID=380244 RepID=A0A1G9LFA3_9ACTN|nr:hypothetical protein [Glycomyces sambucus]SDL60544.1 hypothetical protein SAMN05216298_4473 [Glycomyces sambucus]
MPGRRGAAAAIGAAALLATTAGCGMLGLGGEDEKSDEDRLVEMVNESNRIEAELASAEFRVVEQCLEEQGYTVHDPWMLQPYESPEQESLTEYYPHESFLVDAEEAAEYGFGQWANSPDGWEDPATEDYWAAEEEEYQEDGWEEPDTTDWDALEPEEQYGWYVAYQGQEYAEWQYGSAQDYADMMSGEGEFAEEEVVEGEESAEGEIDVEEDMEPEPKPGGCQLEMIEALWGEPTLTEDTWEGEGGAEESYSYWTYRPENPTWGDETMWEDIELEYGDKMVDLQTELVDCISARGYEGWEFDQYNSLPVWEFFGTLYYQNATEEEKDMMVGDSDAEVPPIPDAAGTTYEEWKAYEIQTAVDFAECGEETGYADASEKAYAEVHVEAYAAIEQDVYGWQEEMNDAITKAQELLDA